MTETKNPPQVSRKKHRKSDGKSGSNGAQVGAPAQGIAQKKSGSSTAPNPKPQAKDSPIADPFEGRESFFFGRNPNNPLRPSGFLGDVFDFLSSLQLAVILLSVLGIVCMVGTVYESNYTADLAKRLVYRAPWFNFLLGSIFLSVVFATLSRYPWTFQQTGWLVTHLGVLSIIVGSMISHRYGVEGNMMLFEGQAADRITMPTSTISIQKVGDNARYKFDTTEVEWGHPERSPQTYPFDELGVRVVVDDFQPDSEMGEVWTDKGQSRNPAVKFAIESSFAGTMADGWLAPRIAGHRSMNMGPATITAKELHDEADLAAELSPQPAGEEDGKGWLSIVWTDTQENFRVPVEDALAGKVQIGETGYFLQATEQLDYAYLSAQQELENNPSRDPNPLVIYDVYKGDEPVASRQFKFSLMPEFESTHGIEEDLPFAATYKRDVSSSKGGAEFVLLLGPGEDLRWKVTTSTGAISSGTLEVGRPVPMAMMTAGMNLVVDEFYPNAQLENKRVAKKIKRGEFRNKAAHLVLQDQAGNNKDIWLESSGRQRVQLGGDFYEVAYASDQFPLGFSIHSRISVSNPIPEALAQ